MNSNVDYNTYYRNQACQRGGSMPYFAGARYQRGHGIGQIFSSIRAALPGILRTFGRHAMNTGLQIGRDVMSGSKFADVAGRHAIKGLLGVGRELGSKTVEALERKRADMEAETIKRKRVEKYQEAFEEQTGAGRKRRKQQKKQNTTTKIKKRKRDIFS